MYAANWPKTIRSIPRNTDAAMLCWVLAYSAPATAADWIADASLRGFFDDNISRALSNGDKKADFGFGTAASAGQFLQLTDSTSLTLTGDFNSDVYSQYGGLNHYALGATASLKQKFGVGAYAPWISLSGSARHADYQSAIRDSWFYSAGLTLGKRLGDKWDLRLEYSYLRRLADRKPAPIEYDEKIFSGAVFNQTNHGLKLSAIYALNAATTLVASYAFRTGDAFSTGAITDAIADMATAATPDDAFGPGRLAYKLPADTNSFMLAAGHALNAYSSINLGYEHHWTTTSPGLAYHANVIGLSLLSSF